MAITTTKPDREMADSLSGASLPAWPHAPAQNLSENDISKPSQRDALQALLAFSALHDQVRRRKALTSRPTGFDSPPAVSEFEATELFVLDEVLQLVAERAVAITGADGLAIALAESNEIVLRASAGNICPDPGTRIDRDSAFSGACFRSAQIVICDDAETDQRVNLHACRKLGARSMVAVPLCGRRRVIGVLEAFSSWPFAFNEIDVRNLSLLAELVLAALKPEDEDRFAQSAQVAATKLEAKPQAPKAEPPKAAEPNKVEAPRPAAPKISVPPATVVVPQAAKTGAPVEPAKPASPAASATPVSAPPVVKPPATEPQKPVQPQVTAPVAKVPTAPFIRTTPVPPSPKPVEPAAKSLTPHVTGAASAVTPIIAPAKPVEPKKLDTRTEALLKDLLVEAKKEESKKDNLTKAAASAEAAALEPTLAPAL